MAATQGWPLGEVPLYFVISSYSLSLKIYSLLLKQYYKRTALDKLAIVYYMAEKQSGLTTKHYFAPLNWESLQNAFHDFPSIKFKFPAILLRGYEFFIHFCAFQAIPHTFWWNRPLWFSAFQLED